MYPNTKTNQEPDHGIKERSTQARIQQRNNNNTHTYDKIIKQSLTQTLMQLLMIRERDDKGGKEKDTLGLYVNICSRTLVT